MARGRLTEREREVLALAAEGNADKVIAAQLGITDRTVRFHLSECQRRLGAASRAQAVAAAIESGELQPAAAFRLPHGGAPESG